LSSALKAAAGRKALLIVAVLLMGCGGAPQQSTGAVSETSTAGACQNAIRACMSERRTPPEEVIERGRKYSASVRTARGDFTIQLDPAAAPVTVNNFVYLAQRGYYDNLTFHRVEPGFVVQGGDPSGNGTGGPGYKLPDETNPAAWVKGSVGMASSPAGVNGSQFFVLLGDAPHLARVGVFNHFGSVVAGMEVVQAIRPGDLIKGIDISAS
jgi:cyclophilin family peptidyl-prolyl cis-trans isomerase